MTPDDLAHALPTLLPRKGAPAVDALEQTEESSSFELPLEELQRLRLRQHRNAQIFERQKSRVHFPPLLLLLSAAFLTERHRDCHVVSWHLLQEQSSSV